MRRIKNCSLIAIDTAYHGATMASLKKCMKQCEFDKVLFFTNISLIAEGVDIISIDPLIGKDAYSHFILKEVWRYIDTDFVLVVQHDSWILNADCFDEKLYEVDYAGGLWIEPDGLCNGNGGFSWRSKRLMDIVGQDEIINATAPEDVSLCRVYRRYLEKNYGLIWADDELCEKFSYELRTPKAKTFGFHGRFHEPYRDMVIIRRMAAMGDVIQTEPVLRYFHEKGYRVVLETMSQFEVLFQRHDFPVLFPHQIDPRVLATAKRFNLDMSYESDPQKLHLQAYFEFCGVSDYKLSNPKLNMGFEINDQTRMFKKYAVLHIDKRSTPHRNIENIDWYKVVQLLKSKGYEVIQLGRGEHLAVTGAIEMNTVNENLLMYVCAGASLMIGIDSGISHICAGFNIPMILFFGSVKPEYIHANLDKIIAIHRHDEGVCKTPWCWHSVIGCEGVECIEDKEWPPCCDFKNNGWELFEAINKLTNE